MLPAKVENFKDLLEKENHDLDDKILRVDNLRAGTTESDVRDIFNGKSKVVPLETQYTRFCFYRPTY